MLWPDSNTGLFVSYNSVGGVPAVSDLVQKFLDHYYPVTRSPPQPANFNDAPTVTGIYQSTRSIYTPALKFLNPPQTIDVIGYPNGTLTTSTSPVRLVEVAPLVFARADGNTTSTGSYAIFTTGGNGTYLHLNSFPQYYERITWLNYWDPLKLI